MDKGKGKVGPGEDDPETLRRSEKRWTEGGGEGEPDITYLSDYWLAPGVEVEPPPPQQPHQVDDILCYDKHGFFLERRDKDGRRVEDDAEVAPLQEDLNWFPDHVVRNASPVPPKSKSSARPADLGGKSRHCSVGADEPGRAVVAAVERPPVHGVGAQSRFGAATAANAQDARRRPAPGQRAGRHLATCPQQPMPGARSSSQPAWNQMGTADQSAANPPARQRQQMPEMLAGNLPLHNLSPPGRWARQQRPGAGSFQTGMADYPRSQHAEQRMDIPASSSQSGPRIVTRQYISVPVEMYQQGLKSLEDTRNERDRLRAERDRLLGEVQGLRMTLEWGTREREQLRAEVERLKGQSAREECASSTTVSGPPPAPGDDAGSMCLACRVSPATVALRPCQQHRCLCEPCYNARYKCPFPPCNETAPRW